MLIKGMVKIIHKNIYSNRLKTIEEVEPYDYDIIDSFTVNSFMMFLSKFPDENLLVKSIIDFCETKRDYISVYIEKHIINNEMYYNNMIKFDLKALLSNYKTEDILDFLDICINNIDNIVQKDTEAYNKHPFSMLEQELLKSTNLKQWFISSLNDIFVHNNLGYEVLNDIIVTKQSDFLHVETVNKTLTLLVNEEFNGPLQEFENAIRNYTSKDYENAVIEACKAYESTMKTILDKKVVIYNKNQATASTLVNLLKDNNIFDSYLIDSITKITNILTSGLPVVRNKQAGHGDGAEVNEVERSYASFAINLAGSYIVFLIDRYYETLE